MPKANKSGQEWWRKEVEFKTLDNDGRSPKTFREADTTTRNKWRGLVVDTVADNVSGETVEIRWDKHRKKFFFIDEAQQAIWASKEIQPIMEAGKHITANRRSMEWVPVIIVQQTELMWGYHDKAQLGRNIQTDRHAFGLAFVRGYLGWNPQKQDLYWLDWDDHAKISSQKKASPLVIQKELVDASSWQHGSKVMPTFPYKQDKNDEDTWIAYDEKIWIRLEQMAKLIDEGRDRLIEMLTPAKVLELANPNPVNLLRGENENPNQV